MGRGDAPSAPAAPDPVKTIQAQAKALPSTYTPYGSSVFSGDPSKGTFTSTQSYSPEVQGRFESSNRLATALLGQAENKAPGLAQAFEFDPNNPTTNQYWGAQKNLLDKVFARQGETLDQKLANQGIPIGAEAYTDATGDLAQQQNSAYEQASANALGQGFSQSLATRQQLSSELANALGQGTPPQVTGTPSNQVDVNEALAGEQAGINRQYQGQLAGYNANQANTQAGIGATAAIAAAVIL
jgi:hypothetical protein